MRGKFITLEGGEGTGKTSQIKMIAKYFEDKGIPFLVSREPGGIDIAEQIREVILNTKNTKMDKRTEALLYAAARRQHLVERVIPALNSGITVVCDRFVDSSLVYQGHARGIGIDEVMDINKFAIDDCMPELTIYLDIEPEKGLERISKNKDREVNRLDLENLEFHKKVREGYKMLLSKYPERIKTVDASSEFEKVTEDIIAVIEENLRL